MKIDVPGVDPTDFTDMQSATIVEIVEEAVEAETSQSPGHVEILTDDGVVPAYSGDRTRDGDSA